MDALPCWLRLQLTPGLGRVGLFRLIDHYHSPQAAVAAADQWRSVPGIRPELAGGLPAAGDPRLDQLQQRLGGLDAWILTFWDADYPPC